MRAAHHLRTLGAAILTALPATALAQRDAAPFARVDSVMLDDLRRTATPGGAIAIVSGDRVVHAKGFGRSAAEGGVDVTPDMLFHVASVTKVFTAATLATLAEQQRVDLAAPIGDRLGELPAPFRLVTPHQLLSHTAGLANGPVPPGDGQPATALESSVRMMPARLAFATPGEIFSYSNAGYALAGRAIEVASGKPYADAVRELVLAPLGMTASTFDTTAAAAWPFAGLLSSATELSRFAIAFMNGGRIGGRPALAPAVIARIMTPVASFVSNEGEYGYGVRLYRHRGVDVVEHGGTGPGGRGLLYMVPARRVAVIVLANRAGPRAYAVADAALDALLAGTVGPVAAAAPAVPIGADEMARLAGHYESGTVAIDASVDDGVLVLHQGTATLPVRKLADGRFVAGPAEGGNFVAFVPGADGATRWLHFNMRAYLRR